MDLIGRRICDRRLGGLAQPGGRVLGRPHCERARDQFRLNEAARKSGAAKIIDSLPHGFDQMLGKRFEDGTDVSGGEWQKFALARAYLRDAGILI